MLKMDDRRLETLVLDVVAVTCRKERRELTASTSLLEADLDSLTLSAVLSQIEVACNVLLSDTVTVKLLGARDFRELCSTLVWEVRAAREKQI
jgi:Phosphopantetheine attachment site